ncbi:MAG: hypothetical protein MUO82_05990 [Candidatus Thermoplasmatota archaeon]|nr:hypothetical protein [Candidatus Thermoplasmatota archaeon]
MYYWVEHNNCDPSPEIEKSESGNIIKRTYANGTDSSEVVLYTCCKWWSRMVCRSRDFFCPPCKISATNLIWEFFKAHPKQLS